MDGQWADLKAVQLVEVMAAQLAKTTAELTDEKRALWKVSKLAELMEAHSAGLTVVLLVVLMVFQSAETKAVLMDGQKVDLMDARRAAGKDSKLAEWTEIHWAGLTVVLLVVLSAFQSAEMKAVLTEEKWAGSKDSKKVE